MYCYKCGQLIPKGQSNCPICETPARRKQIARRRLFLGLLIFLAGAITGSFIDILFLKYSKSTNNITLNNTKLSGRNGDNNSNNNNESKILDNPLNMNVISGKSEFNTLITSTAANIIENYNLLPQATFTQTFPISTYSQNSSSEINKISSPSNNITSIQVSTNTPEIASSLNNIDLPLIKHKLLLDKVYMLENEGSISYHPCVSKEKTLVFSSNRLSKNKNVDNQALLQCFIKDISNYKNKAQLAFSWQGNVWTPEILPNFHNKIIFSSDFVKPEHIFIFDIKTNKYTQITNGNIKCMMPSISPDGKMVAFVSNKKGNNDIWLINISGDGEIQLTTDLEDEREPRWFPDSKAIIYTKIVQKLKESYIMKINLEPIEQPQALVKTKARNWMADVSPCGNYLAYVRSTKSDGSGNVILIKNLNTEEEFQIKATNISEFFYPRWLKDGSAVVFHGETGKQKNIYIATFKKVEIE